MGEAAVAEVPKVILDFAFLQQDMVRERSVDDGEGEQGEGMERASMKMLVMVETECDSVWA